MALISRAELSRRLGVSRAAITIAIRDGRLEGAVAADGRVDAERGAALFLATTSRPLEPPRPDPVPWANALLDPDCWGPPPWTARQWASLRDVWMTACELTDEGRVYSPSGFHAWEIESSQQIAADGEQKAASETL